MNGDILSDKLMGIVADQARASAELAATQRENVEHLKDLHELSRESGVLLDKMVDRMERMDTARGIAVSDLTREIKSAKESVEDHVSTEVVIAAAKLGGGMKLLSAVIGAAAAVIAAAISFAAVWYSNHPR